MMRNLFYFGLSLLTVILAQRESSADDVIVPLKVELSREVSFAQDIQPIFEANCAACHNAQKSEGGLNLESFQSLMKGGDSGKLVISEEPDNSYLYNVAACLEESFMPPIPNSVNAQRCTPEQIWLLRQWIREGAENDLPVLPSQNKWENISEQLSPIFAVALDETGRFAVAGRAGTATVHDLATGINHRLLDADLKERGFNQQTHLDFVHAIAFHPDRSLIATAGYQSVKIWKRNFDAVLQSTDAVVPSSQSFAVGSRRLTLNQNETGIVVVDSETQEELQTLSGSRDMIAVSANKRFLAIGEANKITVYRTAQLPFAKVGQSDSNAKVVAAVDNAGQSIATIDGSGLAALHKIGSDKALALLNQDFDVAQQIRRSNRHVFFAVEQQKHIKQLLAAAKAIKTKQDEGRKKEVAALEVQKKKRAEAAAKLQSDTAKLATAQERLTDNPEDAKLKKQLETATANASKSMLTVDAESKAEARLEKQIALTDASLVRSSQAIDSITVRLQQSEKRLQAVQKVREGVPNSAAFQTIGVALIHGVIVCLTDEADDSFRLRVFDQSGTPIDSILLQGLTKPIQIAATKDGFLVQTKQQVFSLNAFPEWQFSHTFDDATVLTDRVLALVFSPDGSQLAMGTGEASRSGHIAVVDLSTNAIAHEFRNAHSDTITSLEFSADGQRLASAGSDKFARTFDLETERHLQNFEGHTNHVLDVSWNAAGTQLVTGSADNTIKIWNAEDGQQVRTIKTFRKEVTGVTFVGTGDEFVSSSGDQRLFRHKASNGATVREFKGSPDFVSCSATTGSGHPVIAGGDRGVLFVWEGGSGKLIQELTPEVSSVMSAVISESELKKTAP